MTNRLLEEGGERCPLTVNSASFSVASNSSWSSVMGQFVIMNFQVVLPGTRRTVTLKQVYIWSHVKRDGYCGAAVDKVTVLNC